MGLDKSASVELFKVLSPLSRKTLCVQMAG
jgi:hypothetical protein